MSSSTRRTPRRSHTLPPTVPLSAQVGGHTGVQMTEDGSLLLKPALPREITFYQLVRDGLASNIDAAAVTASRVSALRPWIPKFLGILSLADHNPPEACAPDVMSSHPTAGPTQTLVLENLAHRFLKPCILDIKLGTVLYDEDASQEKKERMIEKAAATTSLTTGMCLTGFQVYADDHQEAVLSGRKYGQSITPDQLPEGIAQFFPVCLRSASDTSSVSAVQPGLPPSILRPLLTHLLSELEKLRVALSETQMRMIGSSVLVIYEGDWTRAEEALLTLQSPSAKDEEVEVEEEDNLEDNEGEEAACLFSLTLIDFAHTRIAPGEGPDQGVSLGIDTLLELVRGRLDTVKKLVEQQN